METNKLLTLEDIEKIETSINQQNYSDDDVFNLAATARAYWELKEPSEEPVATSSYRGLGSEEYYQHQRELKEATQNGYEAAKREMADKPHPATLKVIEGYNEEKNIIARGCPTMSEWKRRMAEARLREIDKAIKMLLTQSLEKHLE